MLNVSTPTGECLDAVVINIRGRTHMGITCYWFAFVCDIFENKWLHMLRGWIWFHTKLNALRTCPLTVIHQNCNSMAIMINSLLCSHLNFDSDDTLLNTDHLRCFCIYFSTSQDESSANICDRFGFWAKHMWLNVLQMLNIVWMVHFIFS